MVNLFSWQLTHHFCRLLQYDRVVHMDADTFVANVSIYSMSLWHWYSFLCCASRGVTDSTITTHSAMSMRQHGLQCAVRLIWYNAIRYNAMQCNKVRSTDHLSHWHLLSLLSALLQTYLALSSSLPLRLLHYLSAHYRALWPELLLDLHNRSQHGYLQERNLHACSGTYITH